MSGYVFHCTPCGHAHAGECPPPRALDWVALLGESYLEEHLRGPFWELSAGATLGVKWKVVSINPEYNTVTVDNTHVRCDVRPEAFTEIGQDNGVLRFRLRRDKIR